MRTHSARTPANRTFEIREEKVTVFKYDLLNPVSVPESEEE